MERGPSAAAGGGGGSRSGGGGGGRRHGETAEPDPQQEQSTATRRKSRGGWCMGDGTSDCSDSEADDHVPTAAVGRGGGGDVAAGAGDYDDYYRFEIRMPGTSFVFRRKVK